MKELKPKFQVEFLEQNRKHYYRIRGEDKLYESVTAFLNMVGGSKSSALQAWSKNQAVEYIANSLKDKLGKNVEITDNFINEIVATGKKQPQYQLEAAADIGSKCHRAIDDYIITGKIPEMDEQTTHLFNSFMSWLKEHKLKFILPDTAVIFKGENNFSYGGKFDAIVENEKGELILVDFKSSNHIVDDYALQLSAYYLAFKYTYGIELDGGMIVRFDKKEPKFETKEISKKKMIENLETFKGLVSLKQGFDKGLWV